MSILFIPVSRKNGGAEIPNYVRYSQMTIWKSSEEDESKRIKLHQFNEIAKVVQAF